MLPAIPINSKIIFHGNKQPVRKVMMQGAEISKTTQEKLKCLLDNSEDIMSSFTTCCSIPHMFPLKHSKLVRCELEDLEKTEIIRRGLSPYAFKIVIVPIKCLPSSPMKDTKRLYID